MFSDDFADGAITDWDVEDSGGSASVYSSLGNISIPCMKVYKNTLGSGEASATHKFPVQGGDFAVEAKLSTPSPSGYHYFMVLTKDDTYGVHIAIKTNSLQYFDTTWHSIGVTCYANVWYLVTLNIHAATGYYDIYVDGVLKKSNALFFGGVAEQKFPNAVKFQAGYSTQTAKTFYVDDVVVRGGKVAFVDQFDDNLDDWTKESSGGPVSWDQYNGLCAKPSISLYKQYVSGGTSARHYFSVANSGRVFLEARFNISTIAEWKWCYINLCSDGNGMSYIVLRDGLIKYYTGSWYTTSYSYSAGSWVKIGLDVDLASGTYDIYANGAKIASYISVYPGGSSVNNVYLQSGCYNDLSGVTLWVDDITVTSR